MGSGHDFASLTERLCAFPSHEVQLLIDKHLKQTGAIFLVVYTGLLIAGQIAKRQSITGAIILFLAAIELVHFDRITVNRPTVTKQELRERVALMTRLLMPAGCKSQ